MSDCQYNTPNRGPDAGDVQTQRQQLDEQTGEALLDKLVDCLFSLEGDTDTSDIDRCLEELDAAGVACEDFDVEQGLKDFHERFGAAFESGTKEVKKTARNRRPLVRIAIIAAALSALFAVTAQASGFDILGAIARWTNEQFSFMKVGETKEERQEDSPYSSLQDALDEYCVEEQIAPTKFPEGSEFSKVQFGEEEGGLLFSATYALDGERFFIYIRQTDGSPYVEVEINDTDVESYWAGGIEHLLMTDVKQRKVMWRNGQWECYIAGDLSRTDLIAMIDSIYV